MVKKIMDDLYYDSKENYKIERKNNWKLKLISKYNKGKGLDIGAGSGRWLDKFPNWTGIDIDKRSHKNKRIKYGDITKIPFKSKTFNIALTAHILEHVPRNKTQKAINEIKRVLKKEGILVIFGPNPANHNFYNDPTHINPLNLTALESILTNSGFKVIERDYSLYRRLGWSFLLPRFIIDIFGQIFLTEYFLVVRKS